MNEIKKNLVLLEMKRISNTKKYIFKLIKKTGFSYLLSNKLINDL